MTDNKSKNLVNSLMTTIKKEVNIDSDEKEIDNKNVSNENVKSNDKYNKKRKNEFVDSNRNYKRKSKDDIEIRFLISRKNAGAIIGKGGANISFLRQNFESSFSITDCNGPERVLTVNVHNSQIEQILASIIGYLEETNQLSVIKLLLHTHYVGSIIGKGGSKLKEIKQENNASIKIFSQCCPKSSERVCIVQGQPENVITCVRSILDIVLSNQQNTKIMYYNPINYDANYALSYGGFLSNSNNKMSNNNNPYKNRKVDNKNRNQPQIWAQDPNIYNNNFKPNWNPPNPIFNQNFIQNQPFNNFNYPTQQNLPFYGNQNFI